jgi:hypothetical protein
VKTLTAIERYFHMQTHIIGRAVALVAGVIATGLALGILLEDVLFGSAAFELKHALTIGTVALAILALHLIGEAWRTSYWYFGVPAFTILFCAATALVVVKSTGNQAAHAFQSQAEADLAAEERARIKPQLIRAEKMLQEALDKIQDDCVNGKKSKGHCDGLRTTQQVYSAAVSGHKGDLARLGAPKPVAAEAENFAALAEVFGADKGRVKAGAVLVLPFVQTALLEFGSIWCLSFAFRRGAQVKVEAAKVQAITERPAGELTDDEIESVRRLYSKRNLALTNNELASKLSCSKAEASKRATKCVAAGVLTRVQHGREVRLQLASAGQTLN